MVELLLRLLRLPGLDRLRGEPGPVDALRVGRLPPDLRDGEPATVLGRETESFGDGLDGLLLLRLHPDDRRRELRIGPRLETFGSVERLRRSLLRVGRLRPGRLLRRSLQSGSLLLGRLHFGRVLRRAGTTARLLLDRGDVAARVGGLDGRLDRGDVAVVIGDAGLGRIGEQRHLVRGLRLAVLPGALDTGRELRPVGTRRGDVLDLEGGTRGAGLGGHSSSSYLLAGCGRGDATPVCTFRLSRQSCAIPHSQSIAAGQLG